MVNETWYEIGHQRGAGLNGLLKRSAEIATTLSPLIDGS